MKLVTYKSKDSEEARLGFLHDDLVVDMQKFGAAHNSQLPNSMLELLDLGFEIVSVVNELIAKSDETVFANTSNSLSDITLLAPIPKPRKNIFGIGLNYTEHVAESARTLDTAKELPQKAVIFSKPPTAVTGPNTEVLLNPRITQQLDWEVELAVVIGKMGKNISKEDALDYVFGYTIINDISARDCRRAGQWIVSKGQDTFAPMGPILITKDEMGNPHDLNLSLTVNGIEKQNSNTKFMLFNVNDLINDLSEVFTLESGDVIASGTPAGVGAGRNPQEWLKDGDVIHATVEKIGTLVNTVKAI